MTDHDLPMALRSIQMGVVDLSVHVDQIEDTADCLALVEAVKPYIDALQHIQNRALVRADALSVFVRR